VSAVTAAETNEGAAGEDGGVGVAAMVAKVGLNPSQPNILVHVFKPQRAQAVTAGTD
jgi:hypothetical protein